jgi:ribosomal-protein-alanine N-acetyltransferase
MNYNFVKMTGEYAEEISKWHYDGIYSFYDADQDEEDLQELLDPSSWEDMYFAVLDKSNKLSGFFIFEFPDDIMQIGLGLSPGLAGKGLGAEYNLQGIRFGIDHFKYTGDKVHLLVAVFNERAIKVYKKIGFHIIDTVRHETNGSVYEFVKMEKKVN